MNTQIPPFSATPGAGSARVARMFGVALLLGGAAFGALAQYKVVSPDGKVTYTDKPPTASDIRVGGNAAAAGPSGGGLPYETRQAATRYPVTLYAAKGSPACDSARQWLRSHAIPFNEYSVNTNSDYAQLQQRFGDTLVPVITIGGQTLKGYSSGDLQSYIEAAGYPKQAHLTGYAWPAPQPLAPIKIEPATAATAPAPSEQAPAPLLPPPSKSGIQF